MRLYELLTENVSKESSIKNIVDILSVRLPALYHKLGIMADRYYEKNKELGKGFAFVTGSQKSSWIQDVYVTEMSPALYALVKFLPPSYSQESKRFLSDNISPKFDDITETLVSILMNIAVVTKNEKLLSGAKAADHARNRYEALLDKLESISVDDEDDDTGPATTKDNTFGQQQDMVQAIINDVLSRPEIKKYAGDIRNKISKSANKLVALKAELEKRGIRF